MTTLTFESINHSPRRAAVRRGVRPAPRVQAVMPLPISVVVRETGSDASWRTRRALLALFGLTVALHAGVIVALRNGGEIGPLPPKQAAPLAIDLAPPPPPPPPPPKVEPPKPLPRVVKVAPAMAPPQLPVVSQAPADNGPPTADTVQVAVAAPAAPVIAPPAPPPPEPVSEPRGFAGYRNNPAPDYPVQAQDRGQQGRVLLNVHVTAQGRVDNITVSQSTGFKILDDSAIKAVRNWSFEPAMRGKTPVDAWVKVPLSFKI
jgi:protein TonB